MTGFRLFPRRRRGRPRRNNLTNPVRHAQHAQTQAHFAASQPTTCCAPPRRRPQPPAFDKLVASNPSDRSVKRSLLSSIGSFVFHAALIVGAIVVTMGAAEVVRDTELRADTSMVFITPPEPQEIPEPAPEQAEKRVSVPAPPVVATLKPPARGFQTVKPPIDVPTDIPEIDVSQHFDPRNYSGRGVEGGIFNGVRGGTHTVDANRVYLVATVEEAPVRLGGPVLKYPEIMRRNHIEGCVMIEYVVNADGSVDPSSLQVRESTHKGFEYPAQQLVRHSKFRPGQVHGMAVKVVVEQKIAFNLPA